MKTQRMHIHKYVQSHIFTVSVPPVPHNKHTINIQICWLCSVMHGYTTRTVHVSQTAVMNVRSVLPVYLSRQQSSLDCTLLGRLIVSQSV
jgi:hypothetical protein